MSGGSKNGSKNGLENGKNNGSNNGLNNGSNKGSKNGDLITGTIIKGVGGQYTVYTTQGQKYICNARGLFRKNKEVPIVGDRVQIKSGGAETSQTSKTLDKASDKTASKTGTLMALMPRSNQLRRPRVANVDQVMVVLAAAQPELHFTMLDRYLIQAEHEGIDAAICINKIDLDDQIPRQIQKIYTPAGYPVFAVSVLDAQNIEMLKDYLKDKTTVLAGPSGVGKTSIINCLTEGQTILKTGAVSERIGRGRHTTRHAEFIPIIPSGYIIDTPGFSSLDPPEVPERELAALFREFGPWLGKCRFRDCLHDSEPEQDCAVKGQVGQTITRERYERYLEFIKD